MNTPRARAARRRARSGALIIASAAVAAVTLVLSAAGGTHALWRDTLNADLGIVQLASSPTPPVPIGMCQQGRSDDVVDGEAVRLTFPVDRIHQQIHLWIDGERHDHWVGWVDRNPFTVHLWEVVFAQMDITVEHDDAEQFLIEFRTTSGTLLAQSTVWLTDDPGAPQDPSKNLVWCDNPIQPPPPPTIAACSAGSIGNANAEGEAVTLRFPVSALPQRLELWVDDTFTRQTAWVSESPWDAEIWSGVVAKWPVIGDEIDSAVFSFRTEHGATVAQHEIWITDNPGANPEDKWIWCTEEEARTATAPDESTFDSAPVPDDTAPSIDPETENPARPEEPEGAESEQEAS